MNIEPQKYQEAGVKYMLARFDEDLRRFTTIAAQMKQIIVTPERKQSD